MKQSLMGKLVAFILCVIVVCSYTIPCSAQKQQDDSIIKVAYFNMGNYYSVEPGGNIVSYDNDALDKISSYPGLKFEYVDCGTWSNALKMLEEHQVDLVGTAQWSRQREDKYEYCLESYGYTMGEMAVLGNNNMVYEDYDSIGQSVIGCTKNYVRRSETDMVFSEHNISPVIKTYENQEELEEGFLNGEFDIIASNSHTMQSDWNVIEKFSYFPFYFISWKGNTVLTDTIDNAIIKINLQEPNADDELMNKYFPDILGEPLNQDELDLINEGKEYTVYYSEDIKPLSWYDKETESMRGALIDACNQINEITGLNIVVRPISEKPKNSDENRIMFTTLFSDSTVNISNDQGVTNALITEPFNLFHKSGNNIDIESGTYTIAFVGTRNLLEDYIKEKYPKCQILNCSSPAECIKKLEKGEADLAYLSVHIADNILTEQAIDDIRELPTDEKMNGIAMYFTGDNAQLLQSIVNKGIQKIDQTKISNSMVQYALTTKEIVTWKTIIRDYAGVIILGVVALVVILVIIVILITYANVMRRQKIKIESANADRTEFFARMSYDMRTPMNGILGMIELTRQSKDVDIMHDNMDKALASSEYMLSLINDTLDLQKLESKKMKLNREIVYTADYFDSIFSMMRISATKKNIDLRITNVNMSMEKYIEIDKIRVKQIFTNLISNAIKFTPEHGVVEIIMECLGEKENTSLKKFTVRDTGIGMSRDFIDNKIYKPYSQENSEVSSELTGTGLGLAITKNLIDIMGGELKVESELGVGTTFTFTLEFTNISDDKAKEIEKKNTTKAKVVKEKLVGKKILLCEDHPLNAEIAKRLLEKAGCIVDWAQNGKIGVNKFSESKEYYYDAVLMDIRMPEMNGIEAAMAIRAIERADSKAIPIIAMTANAYDEDIRNSYEAGMNAHLAKPVEPNKLYETLEKYILE